MSMPLLLILLLAFLAGALLALAVMGLLGAEREAVARRLEGLARPAAPGYGSRPCAVWRGWGRG